MALSEIENYLEELGSSLVSSLIGNVEEFWWLFGGIAGIGFSLLFLIKRPPYFLIGPLLILGAFLTQPVLTYFSPQIAEYYDDPGYLMSEKNYYFFWGGMVLSFIFLFLGHRYLVSFFDRFRHRFSKSTGLARSTKTDIRFIEQHLPKKVKQFNPRKYYRIK